MEGQTTRSAESRSIRMRHLDKFSSLPASAILRWKTSATGSASYGQPPRRKTASAETTQQPASQMHLEWTRKALLTAKNSSGSAGSACFFPVPTKPARCPRQRSGVSRPKPHALKGNIRGARLSTPLERILQPLLGECAIQVEGPKLVARRKHTGPLSLQSDSRWECPLRAEAALSQRPLRDGLSTRTAARAVR